MLFVTFDDDTLVTLTSFLELELISFSVGNVAEVRDPGRLNPGYWNFGGWIAAGGEFQSDDNVRGLNDGDTVWFEVCGGGEL